MFLDMGLNKMNAVIFGVIILFVAILAITSISSLSRVDSSVEGYTEFSQDYAIAAEITKSILRVRMKMKDFLLTNSEQDLQGFNDRLEELNAAIAIAQKEINKPSRKVLVQQVTELRDQYVEIFGQVENIILTRNAAIVERYQPDSIRIRKLLSQIIETAYSDGDAVSASANC